MFDFWLWSILAFLFFTLIMIFYFRYIRRIDRLFAEMIKEKRFDPMRYKSAEGGYHPFGFVPDGNQQQNLELVPFYKWASDLNTLSLEERKLLGSCGDPDKASSVKTYHQNTIRVLT